MIAEALICTHLWHLFQDTGWTRFPRPLHVQNMCLSRTVCPGNSVGQWQDGHREPHDRLAPEWPFVSAGAKIPITPVEKSPSH